MGQSERVDHEVGGGVRHRQRGDVRLVEVDTGQVAARDLEHPGRQVEPMDLVAPGREVPRLTAGPAGRVDGHPGREGVEERPDHGLLVLEDRVRSVVRRRPPVVRLGRGQRLEGEALPPTLGVVEQAAHLGDPGPGEGLVVLAGEGPHQRHALETEQERERVLVDPGCGHPGILGGRAGGRQPVSASASRVPQSEMGEGPS